MDEQELATYLDRVRITGNVATPRENNLRHIQGFIDGNEHLEFGVPWTRDWTFEEVFALMVQQVGINPDPLYTEGQDTISSALCVAALGRFAVRLGTAAREGQRVLFATGHPAGLLPVHAQLAEAAARGGAKIVEVREGTPFLAGDIRQIFKVLVWHQHGNLMHTHYPMPMKISLEQLRNEGFEAPDLVVGDHGWAGYAAGAGIDTIGFADCNDPGLFAAQAQGQLQAAVPLDDNVTPGLYQPLTDYIIGKARL